MGTHWVEVSSWPWGGFPLSRRGCPLGQPEILLGLIPGAGGTQRLARIVGYQRAKEMVLTGRQVDAEEALEIGLADQVFPSAELLDATLEAAREWATKATRAIAAAKKALNAAGSGCR